MNRLSIFIILFFVSLLVFAQQNSQNISPKTTSEYIERGIQFASNNEWDMAIADFTEAIKLDNNSAEAYLLRGRALYASTSYVTSVGKNFGNVITTITQGWANSDKRKVLYDKAIDDFTQAIKLDPHSSQAYRERGVAYSDSGDHNRGLTDLNQAILLDPNYAMAYNNRGNIYRRLGNYELAITNYNEAIFLDPNFARAYMNRGSVYHDMGDYNRAILERTKAIMLAPDDAVIYNNRGSDYHDIGDYDRAIADYTQSIMLDPNSSTTYNNRGHAYFEIGDYDRAIADFQTGLQLDPNNTSLRSYLEYARQLKR
jgi:tetratricopeptide (TPR) repeat protein